MKKQKIKTKNEKLRFKRIKSTFAVIIMAMTILNAIITTSNYFIYEKKTIELNDNYLRIENELRPREFDNNLKLTLYKEVKDAITKKDSTIQQATLIMVNNMLDYDSIFREKLINVLLQSTNSSKLIETQKKIDTFMEAETSIRSSIFTIDIFYLEQNKEKTKPLAQVVSSILKQKYPNVNIRERLLPDNINSKLGYQIDHNQIRYDSDINEEKFANEILREIHKKNIFSNEEPTLKRIKNRTKNYLSIFIVGS